MLRERPLPRGFAVAASEGLTTSFFFSSSSFSSFIFEYSRQLEERRTATAAAPCAPVICHVLT